MLKLPLSEIKAVVDDIRTYTRSPIRSIRLLALYNLSDGWGVGGIKCSRRKKNYYIYLIDLGSMHISDITLARSGQVSYASTQFYSESRKRTVVGLSDGTKIEVMKLGKGLKLINY